MGKRRDILEQTAQQIFESDFSGRVLPFDTAAAASFAQISAARRQSGNPISQFDAQIAGICHSRGAKISTRNVSDFQGCGVTVINPWDY